MVDIWFSTLTNQQLRHGVYHKVPEVIAVIEHLPEVYSDCAAPVVCTKEPDQVLAKAIR